MTRDQLEDHFKFMNPEVRKKVNEAVIKFTKDFMIEFEERLAELCERVIKEEKEKTDKI